MHPTTQGQSAMETLRAESTAQAQQCRTSEIATYLDGMLNFAPGPQGGSYVIGKQAQLHAGLNDFLSEAIPLDAETLRTVANLEPPESSSIWRHLHMLGRYLQVCSADLTENPMRALFYEVMSRPQFWYGPWSVFSQEASGIGEIGQKRKQLFLNVILELRRAALSINMERKMGNWNFPAASNALRVKKYDAYLFNRCQEVSAVEILLWHPQSAISNAVDAVERKSAIDHQQFMDLQSLLTGDKNHEAGEESPISIPAMPRDALTRDLRRIFDNFGNKTSISRFKIGHASSIEWSRVIGHHARLMFFFDGSKVVDPVAHARLLCNYCAERTQGDITFVNCNDLPDEYPEAGLILADDEIKRSLLRHRLLLWGQKEQFLRINASRGFKAFRTGDIPAAWRQAA